MVVLARRNTALAQGAKPMPYMTEEGALAIEVLLCLHPTTPTAVDIAVPTEELGLLGLGGDTTFVDWQLI